MFIFVWVGLVLLIIYVINFCLRILYAFFKLKPIQWKILIASRQGDALSLNMKLLVDALKEKYSDIEVKIISYKWEKSLKGVIKNSKYILLTMYHLADSRLCILDGYNMPVSVLRHKKSLKIVQLWHALMAVKQFGYQILNMTNGYKTSIAKALCMHKQYDFVIAGGEGSREHFSKAFNMSLDKILPLGAPIVDDLLQNKNTDIKKTYPQLQNKKTILYVPTFRKKGHADVIGLINAIDFDSFNLFVKLHPLDTQIITDERVIIDKKYHTEELMKVSDIVITDYSALSLTAAILKKQLYFYIPDVVEYRRNQGLNVDMEKLLPMISFRTPGELFSSITKNKYNIKIVEDFSKQFMNIPFEGCTCTDRIVNFVSLFAGLDEHESCNQKIATEEYYESC